MKKRRRIQSRIQKNLARKDEKIGARPGKILRYFLVKILVQICDYGISGQICVDTFCVDAKCVFVFLRFQGHAAFCRQLGN